MSQASHNDPEKYYQESLHRVPMTDAYRDECRDEREDDSIDIDAIEDCILFAHARRIDSRSEIITSKAREQLDALVTEIGRLKSILGDAMSKGVISIDGVNLVEENEKLKANQIPGRCKDCEYNASGECMACDFDIDNENNYCSCFTKREA